MKSWTFMLLLCAGAFAVRVGVALAFRDIHEPPAGAISNDDVQYHLLAVDLAQGYGYRVTPDRPLTSFRAPGFPFVLAALYALIGCEPAAAYLLFALLGAAACVLTYLLAREIVTETAARWAGVFAAIYLPHAFMASTFNSESVYVPCLALGLWLFVRFVKYDERASLTLASLALGYATLTRPGTLLLLPLLLAVLGWRDYREKHLRPLAYVLLPTFFLGVILPWTWRNHEVHGQWVLVATNGGTTFWGGNNDRVLFERKHLGYWLPSTELPDRNQIDAASNEIERDAIEWRLGKDWVRAHWAWLPLLEAYKFARLWWLPDYGEGLRWLRIAGYVPFLLLFLTFACRICRRSAEWTPAWLVLHAAMVAVIATALIFCGEPRYRDAQMPVLMIYAAAAFAGQPRSGAGNSLSPAENTVRSL